MGGWVECDASKQLSICASTQPHLHPKQPRSAENTEYGKNNPSERTNPSTSHYSQSHHATPATHPTGCVKQRQSTPNITTLTGTQNRTLYIPTKQAQNNTAVQVKPLTGTALKEGNLGLYTYVLIQKPYFLIKKKKMQYIRLLLIFKFFLQKSKTGLLTTAACIRTFGQADFFRRVLAIP